jgi:FAD/FMN-containing dehydrogenase
MVWAFLVTSYITGDTDCTLDAEGTAGSADEVKEKARIAFGENYPALQKVKKTYDPDNVFNRWFAITPA